MCGWMSVEWEVYLYLANPHTGITESYGVPFLLLVVVVTPADLELRPPADIIL